MYVLLSAAGLLFVLPLVWMICVSLKPDTELLQYPPRFFPDAPELSAYRQIMRSEHFDFPLYARNTLIIAALSLIGMVLSSAIAAYGFARIRFPGRGLMFAICLATMMIPFPVIMVPTYMIFKELGWIGTFLPLWVPAWFGSAFNIFLLRQFFRTIPQDLSDAARIDGCSEFGIFWRIVLPLSKPALAVVALFHFMYAWKDFMGPLIYLTKQETYTLSLGLQFYQSQHGGSEWHYLMAASTLMILPIILLFFFTQRYFIQGVTLTGIKG